MTTPTESQEQQIATRPTNAVQPLQLSRSFQPITDENAWALAEKIKNSTIIPKDFIGKPENIFIAMLMGREVGLNPMQAVQNIMVVNGRPCMWGDSLPALVYASNKVDKFEEEYDETTKTAICRVRRKGDTKDHVQTFSWNDAVKAGYDRKQGPWQTVPKRMQQMRARAFALRDKFADVLKGLGMIEEAQDYEIIDNTAATQIKMPQEVIDVVAKAEVFSKQEDPAPARRMEANEREQASTIPQKEANPSEVLKIKNAKAKFEEKFGVMPEEIDRYLEWEKLTTFGEIYPRLQSVWKELSSGKANVDTYFGRFKENSPKKQDSDPYVDESPLL